MKRLPCKTVNQLLGEGIDIRNATLILLCAQHHHFPQGELVQLYSDDGTYNPEFIALKDVDSVRPCYVNTERLGIYDPDNPEHIALRARLRLKGAL